jgi:hypothetical protein
MSEADTGSDPGADPGRESDPGDDPETEADSGATSDSGSDPAVLGGKRFVILVYVALVAVTGVFGYIIGLARPENLDPRLLGVISLPPTPVGVALYGMLTVALVLGVLLLAVNYVSQRYDTAAVDGGEQK